MIASAAKSFRQHGFGGIGVDGLAKGADLTSGAFYFHFGSKLGAFVEAIRSGMGDLRQGILTLQEEHGPDWLTHFVSFYLGYKRTCSLGDGCTVPSLSSEAERAGPEAQAAYQSGLLETIDTLQHNLPTYPHLTQRETAWVLLAMLSGGVNMARAVQNPALGEEICAAIAKAAQPTQMIAG